MMSCQIAIPTKISDKIGRNTDSKKLTVGFSLLSVKWLLIADMRWTGLLSTGSDACRWSLKRKKGKSCLLCNIRGWWRDTEGGTNSLLQVLVKFSHFSVLVSTCRCYEDDRNYESSEFSFSKHPHALLLLFFWNLGGICSTTGKIKKLD